MRLLASLLFATLALASCDDPGGFWNLEFTASERLTLDRASFESDVQGEATFTLPEGTGESDAGAFYRVDVSFMRTGAAPVTTERVFLRAVPRFDSDVGVREEAEIIADGDAAPSTRQLKVFGELERCSETGECSKQVALNLGWLSPPEGDANLAVVLNWTVELRGSGDVPDGASATAALQF